MPRDIIDYSNTIIYKIYCSDDKVNDIYVGHTTNFVKRKYQHKILCNSGKKLKLYDTIRNNGGWNNWIMIELAKYNCKDVTEARIREQEHYDILKPKLNSVNPISNNSDIVISIDDNIMKENFVTNDLENFVKNNEKKYTCSKCEYFTDRKSNLDNHFKSFCHNKKFDENLIKYKLNTSNNCETCGKEYKSKSGLWKHKKKCTEQQTCQMINNHNINMSNTQITTELVIELIKDNKDMKKIIMEQHKTINNLVKNVIDSNNYDKFDIIS